MSARAIVLLFALIVMILLGLVCLSGAAMPGPEIQHPAVIEIGKNLSDALGAVVCGAIAIAFFWFLNR